jgi:RND family efflux transporter MFP subunit
MDPDSPVESGKSDKPAEKQRPRKPRRRGIGRTILFLMIIGALAGGGYFYSDVLRGTKIGELMGLEGQASAKDVYYCPMHPDYKADKSGTCPICNMNLVKLEPEKDAGAPAVTADATPGTSTGERKVLYWVDPMNPSHRSDKPGKAPDGMDLVPVYAEEGGGAESLPPGTVKISPQKQQLIGVQYGEVFEQPLSKTIRAVGRLAHDETRIARINTKISGWIDQVYVDFTGKLVKKGQPLISLYSPDLVSAQQELLIAKKAKDTLGSSQFRDAATSSIALYESARERLRLWDISEGQINQIEKAGAPSKTLTLYSPINGFVIMRSAYKGMRITPEMELYSIADVSTIWVLADVYEYELPMIQLGQTATMTLSYYPGETFVGKVTFIYHDLEPTTRTLKVRVEFPNPDFKLKPDMYANVELKIDYGKKLAIPREAVLDSGSEQVVFVALEGGYFEPRKVTLGAQVGNKYIVLAGLEPGERVVTSANFLIDSESQLKSALGGMGAGAHAGHGGEASPTGQEKSPLGGQEKSPPGGKTTTAPHPPKEDHSQHESHPAPADHESHPPATPKGAAVKK